MLLSPKFQDQEVGDPVLLSVNVTVNGAFPVVGDAEKSATGENGFSKTVIVADFESVPFPYNSIYFVGGDSFAGTTPTSSGNLCKACYQKLIFYQEILDIEPIPKAI